MLMPWAVNIAIGKKMFSAAVIYIILAVFIIMQPVIWLRINETCTLSTRTPVFPLVTVD